MAHTVVIRADANTTFDDVPESSDAPRSREPHWKSPSP